MENKTINCCDCKKDFVWTVEQQDFFALHDIVKDPIRCRECAIILMNKKKMEAAQAQQIQQEENKKQDN